MLSDTELLDWLDKNLCNNYATRIMENLTIMTDKQCIDIRTAIMILKQEVESET